MPDFDLHDYLTGERLRAATSDEALASVDAAERDGGAGVILVASDGHVADDSEPQAAWPSTRRCYVIGDADVIRAACGES